MNSLTYGFRTLLCVSGILASLAIAGEWALPTDGPQVLSKDGLVGGQACDGQRAGSAGWAGCLAAARPQMPDSELFQAGYWLAKSARYDDAIRILSMVRQPDERVLTYLGYAFRKRGQLAAALPNYARAIKTNPNYAVARAYLGEAHLARGDVVNAKAELAEISRRNGVSNPAYVDLAAQIALFEAGRG